jgi:hypothetical protein
MNPQEKKFVRGAIQEMVDSMTRVAAERDLQKDIVARVKEETTVTPRIFKKMARTAFKASFAEEVATHEEFESLYEEIIAGE